MMNEVFELIDEKIDKIETGGKRASIIIINEKLFRGLQNELVVTSSQQSYGYQKSPFDLQVYKGIRVATSEVAELVEVF